MRREFSAKVKLQAFDNCGGLCVRCTARLYPGKYRYNHRIPDAIGGEPTLDNCEVLCLNCDTPQTYAIDIPRIAKAKRIRKKHHGIKKPRTIMSWRRFNGDIVRAPRGR